MGNSPCYLNPDAIGVTFHLVTGNGEATITVGFPCPVLPRDDCAHGIHDVLETHGQVVKDIEGIRCEAGEHYLARELDFVPMRLETYGNNPLLFLVPDMLYSPWLKTIRFTLRSYRQINRDLSL